MAAIVSYDLAKLPVRSATPPKHSPELMAEFVAVMQSGKAAGDGVAYETAKAARSAANSIKRGLRRFAEGISTETRTWESKGSFYFALTLRAVSAE